MRRAAQAPRAIRAFSTTQSAQQMARIQLIGRLGEAPEVQPTSTGGEYIRYNIATNSGTKENRQTSWWRVVCFLKDGPQRDFITSLPKGSVVPVSSPPLSLCFLCTAHTLLYRQVFGVPRR